MRTFYYFPKLNVVYFTKKNCKKEFIKANITIKKNKIYSVKITHKSKYVETYNNHDNYVCDKINSYCLLRLIENNDFEVYKNIQDLFISVYLKLNTNIPARMDFYYKYEKLILYLDKLNPTINVRKEYKGEIIAKITEEQEEDEYYEDFK